MNGELILCIPGPWEDRTEFVSSVAADTKGEFIFAGGILLHVGADEHVLARFMNADPQIRKAFEIAGQGKIPAKTMDAIELHRGAAILQFPKRIQEERQKIFRFCEAMKRCGGFAVKVVGRCCLRMGTLV